MASTNPPAGSRDDEHHEYPDPELYYQRVGYGWPTNDIGSTGSPNHEQLNETDRENLDDQSSVSNSNDLATRNWERNEVDTDYQSEHDQEDDSEFDIPNDPEVDTNPPVRTGRRGRPRGRGRGRGRRSALNEEEAADHPRNQKRRKSKYSKRGDKGVAKRGLRKALPPSAKFSKLQSEATRLFVEGNYEKAETIANEAVVENPEQFSAHSLLSEIFYEKGDVARSVAALFAGAHVRMRDPHVWERSATLILERSGDLPVHKMLEDAVYCYGRLLHLESHRMDIRITRAGLLRELGRARKALRDLQVVLRHNPTNIEVLRMAIELAIGMKETQEVLNLYQNLIDLLRKSSPQVAESFTWTDLYFYGEFLLKLDAPADSIAKLKRIARWICGRGTDDYWEYQTQDDCEFDIDREPRRAKVLELADSSYENSQYGEMLPLEIRIHLGILRLQSGDVDEAKRHLKFLRPTEDDPTLAEDFPDLFRLIGEAFREKQLFEDALVYLEPLQDRDHLVDATFYAHLAGCYRRLGRIDDAEKCYRTLIKHNESDMKTRRDMVEMFHAAGVRHRAAPYEDELLHKRKRQYRPMFNNRGLDDRVAFGESHTAEQEPATASLLEANGATTLPQSVSTIEGLAETVEKELRGQWKKQRQNHRKKALDSENQENLEAVFFGMMDLREKFEAGDNTARDAWIKSARELLQKFRETRVFFPFDRSVKFYGYTAEAQAKALRSKAKQMEIDLELAEMLNIPIDELPEDFIPDEFCCVPFEDWLETFLQLAFMMAQDQKQQDCYSILDLLVACNVFICNKKYMFRIILVSGVCALLLEDDEKVGTVARNFMTTFQFNSDTYRLYAALFTTCGRLNMAWYNSAATQKFMLRQIKAVDYFLAKPSDPEPHSLEDEAGLSSNNAAGNPILPQRFDIPLLFLYAQVLYAAGSYTFAMNYFYRARSLDPTNPLINLSLGLSYIHHALTRQSLNRHQIIMQGLAFLFQYHDRRMQSEVITEQQEATYNIGRTFHLLGLAHLAIPRYEKVLELAEKLRIERMETDGNGLDEEEEEEKKGHEDFAVDAAFALQGLYALGGNMKRAKEIVDKWMVL